MFSQTITIRVRYADTDQMKFVYYAKYFEYFEQSRSELLRSLGMPYSAIEAKGFFLPVIEAHCEYNKSARFDELLEIKVMMQEVSTTTIRLEYEVINSESRELLATGYTVHCFLNMENEKPTRAPKFFLDAVQ